MISKTFNFRIIPEICRKQGREITIKEDTEKIHLSRPYVANKDSPYSNIAKLPDSSFGDDVVVDNDICPVGQHVDQDHLKIQELLPAVINEMKRIGKYKEYLSFHKLVSDGKFPLDNIAFLLLLDVVHWFSTTRRRNY